MYTLYWGFKKNPCKDCLLFYCFLLIKRILKALVSLIPWLLNSSDLPSSGSNSNSSIPSSISFNVVATILQNGAKFIQKQSPGFKNHRNLDNFRQAVERPKNWNSMGYFCPKNTFFQLKPYTQRMYLTLLSTFLVKTHQIPYVIFEIISHFLRHKSSVFF